MSECNLFYTMTAKTASQAKTWQLSHSKQQNMIKAVGREHVFLRS